MRNLGDAQTKKPLTSHGYWLTSSLLIVTTLFHSTAFRVTESVALPTRAQTGSTRTQTQLAKPLAWAASSRSGELPLDGATRTSRALANFIGSLLTRERTVCVQSASKCVNLRARLNKTTWKQRSYVVGPRFAHLFSFRSRQLQSRSPRRRPYEQAANNQSAAATRSNTYRSTETVCCVISRPTETVGPTRSLRREFSNQSRLLLEFGAGSEEKLSENSINQVELRCRRQLHFVARGDKVESNPRLNQHKGNFFHSSSSLSLNSSSIPRSSWNLLSLATLSSSFSSERQNAPLGHCKQHGRRKRAASGASSVEAELAAAARGPRSNITILSQSSASQSSPLAAKRLLEQRSTSGGELTNFSEQQPAANSTRDFELANLLAQLYAHIQYTNQKVEQLIYLSKLFEQKHLPKLGKNEQLKATDQAANGSKANANEESLRVEREKIKMKLGADEESLMRWLSERQARYPSLRNASFELLTEYPNRTINICSDGPKILVLPNVSDILYCYTREQWIEKLWSELRLSAFHYPIIVLNITIFLFGTLGNVFVCLSVYRNHQLRNVTNYFIMNLAFADFLVILICLPATVVWDLSLTWFFGTISCKLIMFLQDVSISVSVLTLTAISIDRYYAICHPLKFKSSLHQAKRTIALIWLISLLTMTPDIIYLSAKQREELSEAGLNTVLYSDCNYDWSEQSSHVFQFVKTILLYLLPFILMFCAHYKILKTLHSASAGGQNTRVSKLAQQATSVNIPDANTNEGNDQLAMRPLEASAQIILRSQLQLQQQRQRRKRLNNMASNNELNLMSDRLINSSDTDLVLACSAPGRSISETPLTDLANASDQPIKFTPNRTNSSNQFNGLITENKCQRLSGAHLNKGRHTNASSMSRRRQMKRAYNSDRVQDKCLISASTSAKEGTNICSNNNIDAAAKSTQNVRTEKPILAAAVAVATTTATAPATTSNHQTLKQQHKILALDVFARVSVESNQTNSSCITYQSQLNDTMNTTNSSTSLDLNYNNTDCNNSGNNNNNNSKNRTEFGKAVGSANELMVTMHNKQKLESRRTAAKMLMAIVVLFGICYFPVHMINFLRQFIEDIPQTDITSTISMLAHCVCYLNSAINPIIYNHMNSVFRAEFRKFLAALCLRNNRKSETLGTGGNLNTQLAETQLTANNKSVTALAGDGVENVNANFAYPQPQQHHQHQYRPQISNQSYINRRPSNSCRFANESKQDRLKLIQPPAASKSHELEAKGKICDTKSNGAQLFGAN